MSLTGVIHRDRPGGRRKAACRRRPRARTAPLGTGVPGQRCCDTTAAARPAGLAGTALGHHGKAAADGQGPGRRAGEALRECGIISAEERSSAPDLSAATLAAPQLVLLGQGERSTDVRGAALKALGVGAGEAQGGCGGKHGRQHSEMSTAAALRRLRRRPRPRQA